MKIEQVQALMLLAGFYVSSYQTIPNQYWPDVPKYSQRRAESPWWVVTTEYGKLTIGRRKRVWEIDWAEIGQIVPDIITQDDVTKGRFLIHAWTMWDALKYLTNLQVELRTLKMREAITAALGAQS